MLTSMTLLVFYIILARIIELIISKRNTTLLLRNGGIEFFPSHYKFLVIFHCVFICYFLIKSLNTFIYNENLLTIFILVQLIRFKIIYDLGRFWTTKIIVLQDVPMVKSGFYKYLRHPNYLIVFLEVFLVCLIFFDYQALIYFPLFNLFLLLTRVYYEEKANSKRRDKFKF